MIDIYAEIRKRYGNVRRARGYYLYTEKNVRLLDLWLDGGTAILGRRTGQANLVCKQFLDKGLTGFLPTKADAQLRRALEALLPDYPVIRWYATREKAEQIAGSALQSYPKEAAQPLAVWRPFLGIDTGSGNAAAEAVPIMLVMPAYPVPCGIIAACSRFEASLPPSDALFPPLAYSLARAFFDLKRNIDEEHAEPVQNCGAAGRSERISRTIAKRRQAVLNRKAEAERLLPGVWTQKGWYLFPHIPEAEYPALFMQALDARVLISPEYGTPSILPDCESYTELILFLKSRNG
ncbi:hypothetical protein E4N72_01750 [Treponema vincentii]|uniref:hypothetical protein n=1 Tax=Treponema vincentii TaxID=69710 RepID=UPI0020A2653C|nr:hypothetical protein [Treponema vincentii]UTC45397.1 hypothetical protein E4N72_01750 [Treponema vincentii]